MLNETNKSSDAQAGSELDKFAMSNCNAWRGIEIVKFNQSFNELNVPAATSHKVSVNLASPRYIEAKIGDDLHKKFVDDGEITLIPVNQPSKWRHLANTKSTILQLYVQPIILSEAATSIDADSSKIELVSQLGVRDLQMKHIALALLSELEAGCPSGRLYGEAAATMLAAHLLKHYSTLEYAIRDYKGGIPKQTLRLVLNYINDKISENISLNELAVVANLSRYHFVRQFKQSTGFAPHQFLLNLRIEKAKNLLENRMISIAEVALQTGFADQSHLTRVFKKRFGLTPREFRHSL